MARRNDDDLMLDAASLEEDLFHESPFARVLAGLCSLPSMGWEFALDWMGSRQFRLLWQGLPAVVVALGVLWTGVQAKRGALQFAADRYEDELSKAVGADDIDRQAYLLKALVRQSPTADYKYRLGLVREKQGDLLSAKALMQSIAPHDSAGYPAAHMWLALHLAANRPATDRKATEAAIQHLKRVLAQNPRRADANAEIGRLFMRMGQWTLAEPHLVRASQHVPELYLVLAQSAARANRSGAAQKYAASAASAFRAAVEQDPHDALARVHWSQSLRLQTKLDEAESVLREGVALEDNARLMKALSELLTERATMRATATREQQRDCLTRLGEAVKWDPKNRKAWERIIAMIALGNVPPSAGLAQAALDFAQTDLLEDPRNADARFTLFKLYLALGEADLAVEHLSAAAAIEPMFSLQLISLYRHLGKVDQAQLTAASADKYLAERVTQDPTDLAARLGRVFALKQLGDWAGAESVLREAPDGLEDARVRSALVELLLERFDSIFLEREGTTGITVEVDLLAVLREATTLTPENQAALLRLTWLAGRTGAQQGAAHAYLEELLARGQATIHIHTFLGSLAVASGDYDQARLHFEQAHAMEPNNAFVINNLAWVLAHQPGPELGQALLMANAALESEPDHIELRHTRAVVLVKLRRWREALKELEIVLASKPDDASIHKDLALVYSELGDNSLAEHHLRLSASQSSNGDAPMTARD